MLNSRTERGRGGRGGGGGGGHRNEYDDSSDFVADDSDEIDDDDEEEEEDPIDNFIDDSDADDDVPRSRAKSRSREAAQCVVTDFHSVLMFHTLSRSNQLQILTKSY